MFDPGKYGSGWFGAPMDAFVITPADDANLQYDGADAIIRVIYVGTSGNVRVTFAGVGGGSGLGATVTYVGVPTGAYLWGLFARVEATGTTAGNLLGHI